MSFLALSPAAVPAVRPGRTSVSDTVPLGIQWELFSISGLVGPNGLGTLYITNSPEGYRNGEMAHGARICLKFWNEELQVAGGLSARAH